MTSMGRRSDGWKRAGVLLVALTASAVFACSSESTAAPAAPEESPPEPDAEAPAPDAAKDAAADAGLTGKCASSFGSALTAGFGRIDGVVYAVQKPTDTQCTMPNSDHLIVQVLMGGAVYRMVVNVQSDRSGQDPKVALAIVGRQALPPPAFAEGWHAGALLDYATTLEVHSDAFGPLDMAALVDKVAAELEIGAQISVYAESGAGRPESAHKIHRNGSSKDGAIVLSPSSPSSSPKFLLFRFADQTF